MIRQLKDQTPAHTVSSDAPVTLEMLYACMHACTPVENMLGVNFCLVIILLLLWEWEGGEKVE